MFAKNSKPFTIFKTKSIWSEGSQARPTVPDLRSGLEGVHGFESHPSHVLVINIRLIPDYRNITLINMGRIVRIFKELRYYSRVTLQQDHVAMQQNQKKPFCSSPVSEQLICTFTSYSGAIVMSKYLLRWLNGETDFHRKPFMFTIVTF